MQPLKLNTTPRFQAMIGTGGIGTGMFFAVRGSQTLGREESRGGRFLDRRDYCKLHIIAHYVKTLLGPAFPVIPLGKVGEDDAGRRLLAEMAAAGLDMRYVQAAPDAQTLFSFCFVYPDGSGGNLTTDDSASARMHEGDIIAAEAEFARFGKDAIVLAAPEVPLTARETALQLGTKHGCFRVASFTSEEIPLALMTGLLSEVDLLAINRDEAGAVAELSPDDTPTETIVQTAVKRLKAINPDLQITITAGRDGSWCWDCGALSHALACPAAVQSTAGAGDAHLSGTIAGLVAGLTLPYAQCLGGVVAGLSVTSPHTIHPAIDRAALRAFADASSVRLPASVHALLED